MIASQIGIGVTITSLSDFGFSLNGIGVTMTSLSDCGYLFQWNWCDHDFIVRLWLFLRMKLV